MSDAAEGAWFNKPNANVVREFRVNMSDLAIEDDRNFVAPRHD